MKKITLSFFGIILGGGFLWLALKNADIGEAKKMLFSSEHALYFLPLIMIINGLLPLLRGARLKLLLGDTGQQISIKKFYQIVSVGYFGITVIPARMGEFVIPFLLKKKNGIPMSRSFTAVIIERLMDSLILAALFVLLLLSSFFHKIFPQLTETAHWLVPAVAAVLIALLLVVIRFSESLVNVLQWFMQLLPDRISGKLKEKFRNIQEGLSVIRQPRKMLAVFTLSGGVAGTILICILLHGQMQGIHLSLLDAILILIANIFVAMLPAAPGMIGSFQYACVFALTFLGVDATSAFVYSVYLYLTGVGTTLILGILNFPLLAVSFQELKHEIDPTHAD